MNDQLTPDDLFEAGLEAPLATYLQKGLCEADGSPKAALLSRYAGAVAHAWTHLEVPSSSPLELLASIGAASQGYFPGGEAAWQQRLPAAMQAALGALADAALAPPVLRWLETALPVVATWGDLRALAQHLLAIERYMRMELSAQAVARPDLAQIRGLDDETNHLLSDDPAYAVYRDALGRGLL